MLQYFDVVAPETFYHVELHWTTNQGFMLTTGQAGLIIFGGS